MRELKIEGQGRGRLAIRRGNYVYKFPVNESGESWNFREADKYYCYKGNMYGIPLAKCRLLSSGVLVMEYLEPIPQSEVPDWADFVDCRQVGRNSKGVIKAYDYAE